MLKAQFRKSGHSLLQIALLLLSASVFVACGKFVAKERGMTELIDPGTGTKAKTLVSPHPDQTTPVQNDSANPDQTNQVFEITRVDVLKVPGKPVVKAQVFTHTRQGPVEIINMSGELVGHTARLLDEPDSNGHHRLLGQLYCYDTDKCHFIVLDVRYKIGTQKLRYQQISPELSNFKSGEPGDNSPNDGATDGEAGSTGAATTPAQPGKTDTAPANPPTTNDGTTPVAQPPAQNSPPVQKPPTQAPPTQTQDDDGFDESAAEANPDFSGQGQMGEMVGVPADSSAVDSLEPVATPEGPVSGDDQDKQKDSKDDKKPQTTSTTNAPTTQATTSAPVQPKPTNTPTQSPPPSIAKPAEPAAKPPVQASPAKPSAQTPAAKPAAAAPSKAPAAPQTPAKPTTPPNSISLVDNSASNDLFGLQFLLLGTTSAKGDSERLGQAVGCFGPGIVTDNRSSCRRGGRIIDATELAFSGTGYRLVHTLNVGDNYGTGMMISAIERGASRLAQIFPGFHLDIGPIAKKNGGNFGHLSHQNGLDADIRYVGQPDRNSVFQNGKLISTFDFEKTWAFWKAIHAQKIVQDGKTVTVLNRIFIGPKIKTAFCAWARQKKILSNPDDADIMRRLSPDGAHYNHFHMRLKCSPYYPLCQDQQEPAQGTGC